MYGEVSFEIDNGSETCFEGNYFRDPCFLDLALPESFKAAFREGFSVVGLPDDTLVMHMRSGDVFQPRPLPWYGQPPCQYYADVMKKRAWGRVVVVAQDTVGNPCIRTAIRMGAVHNVSSWEDDLRLLLGARHLALGRGTLGLAVAALSDNLKTMYTFGISGSIQNGLTHENCVPQDGYVKNVIKGWEASRVQLGQIQSSNCAYWDVVVPVGRGLEL